MLRSVARFARIGAQVARRQLERPRVRAALPSVDWQRAGRRVAIERARRWPDRTDFSAATGVSIRTLVALEGGKPGRYSTKVLAAIETALWWEPGTIERIAQGLPVVYTLDRPLRHIHDVWPHLSAQNRRRLANIADELRNNHDE